MAGIADIFNNPESLGKLSSFLSSFGQGITAANSQGYSPLTSLAFGFGQGGTGLQAHLENQQALRQREQIAEMRQMEIDAAREDQRREGMLRDALLGPLASGVGGRESVTGRSGGLASDLLPGNMQAVLPALSGDQLLGLVSDKLKPVKPTFEQVGNQLLELPTVAGQDPRVVFTGQEDAPAGYRYNAAGELELDKGYLQGQAALAAAKQQPTSLVQNLRAAGIDPGSPRGQQIIIDSETKRNQGLGDPTKKEFEQLREAEIGTLQFMATAEDVKGKIADNPQFLAAPGAIARFTDSLASQAEGLAQAFGAQIQASRDLADYADVFQSEGMTEIAKGSAQVQSAIVNLAYAAALASGQSGRSVSDRDVERFIKELGANTGNPEVFSNTISEVQKRLDRNFRIRNKVITGKEGPSLLPEIFAQEALPSDSDKDRAGNFEAMSDDDLLNLEITDENAGAFMKEINRRGLGGGGGNTSSGTISSSDVEQGPVVGSMQDMQARFDHIDARGQEAYQKSPNQRTAEDWTAIEDWIGTFGTPVKAMEEAERQLEAYRRSGIPTRSSVVPNLGIRG